ncbi:ABC transporter substrate-binding protein [Pannonibacter phragmitetus]|uniref:aliphatic sulfonate ABC transporter substrate-binding protein n=1 Tax=Pannonibacter phragmitetus TaxID=121719 RepID=UPI00067B7BA5|nr:aliphatic sulfonate ABC transporter substrate-binding protein [Pannonibacter phragmitetus]KND19325.1 ABC transporter substrate-binding protein [Pannonibacter phragmitetus]MBA4204339.1 taurine ABC transporter substrate-binding protein [Polymorphum sp.]
MTLTLDRRNALLLGFGASALGLFGPSFNVRAQTVKEVRIGWQKGGVVALLKGRGLLEERLAPRGITVSWAEFTSGPPLLEALSAGALDFGTTGDVPPLFAHAARGNLVFAGAYTGSDTGSAILVRKNSGITSLKDLKGRKLAFKRGSSAHNVALQLLRTAGLSLDDVEQVDLSPPDAAPAFANGSIDAWSIWDPYTASAEKSPETQVLATADGVVPAYGFLSANGKFAEQNGELLAELILALREVGEAAQNDLPGTVKAFAAATGLPEDVLTTVATRKGQNYGAIGFVEEKHIVYEQALADDFHALGIIPRKLDIRSAVWTPKSA